MVVHQEANPLAGPQTMVFGEGLVDDHLVRPGLGKVAALADQDVVDDRLPPIGQREHLPIERLGHAVQIDGHDLLDARADFGHFGHGRQPREFGQRRLLYLDGEIGHAALGIVERFGLGEVHVGRGERDEAGHADGDDSRNGQQHSQVAADFTEQFAIERFHHTTSSGGTGCSLT